MTRASSSGAAERSSLRLRQTSLTVLAPQALGGEGHVHGDVAAAADQHFVADGLLQVGVDLDQEVEAELGQFLAGEADDGCFQAPVPKNTLSFCSTSCSTVMSLPTSVFMRNLTPMPSSAAATRSMMSRGRR